MGTRVAAKIFCSKILPIKMTFYGLWLISLAVLSIQCLSFAILFDYKVDSALNVQHENLFKSYITGDKCKIILFNKYKIEFPCCHCGLTLKS